jgi:hypothetical protein
MDSITPSITSTISEQVMELADNKPLIYAGLGCLAVLTILYFNGSISRAQKSTNNQYIIRANEVLPDVSYYTHRGDQIIHIFWTGDIYSTWLICYYFIAAEQPVQPIFLVPKSKPELSSAIDRMTKIRNILICRYPHKKARLLPTYYVTNISKNNSITYSITKIHGRSPWLDPQIMNTLDRQARFAADWPWPVLSAMLPSSQLQAAAAKSGYTLTGQWLDAQINIPELDKLRFPLLARDTDELNRISLDSKHYFYDMLLLNKNVKSL